MKNEIILFDEENIKLEVNLKDETVWLTQRQMEMLFEVSHSTLSEHINNIFREGELAERAKALKVNVGTDPDADLGPVITKEVHTCLYNLCQLICSINEE